MDRIIVFDKGKIISDGTYEDLLFKSDEYQSLWNVQVGGFLPEETH